MKEEHECVNRRRVKDVPGRAAAHLFRNLLNRYLLKPYYVPSTAAGGGGASTKGNSTPGVPALLLRLTCVILSLCTSLASVGVYCVWSPMERLACLFLNQENRVLAGFVLRRT